MEGDIHGEKYKRKRVTWMLWVGHWGWVIMAQSLWVDRYGTAVMGWLVMVDCSRYGSVAVDQSLWVGDRSVTVG